MLLRGSPHAGAFTLAQVSRLARGSIGVDPNGHRAEFVELVEAARRAELLGKTPR